MKTQIITKWMNFIIALIVMAIVLTPFSFGVIQINGTITNTTSQLDTVNVSIYNGSVTLGNLTYSTLTNESGFYNLTLNNSYGSGFYNLTFNLSDYQFTRVSKVLTNNTNYTFNRTLVPAGFDFHEDDSNDDSSDDSSDDTSSSQTSSSGTTRSTGSSSSRGPIYNIREYNLTKEEKVNTTVTYYDVIRLAVNGTKYDFNLAKIEDEFIRFKIGRPVNDYFEIHNQSQILQVKKSNINETLFYVSYYNTSDERKQQIGIVITLNNPDNIIEPDTDTNVDNINLTQPANMTNQTNQTTQEKTLRQTLQDFLNREETLQQTTKELFDYPIVSVPIYLLLGMFIGFSILIGVRHMKQYKNTKKSKKQLSKKSLVEQDEANIVIDAQSKITEILQKQIDAKNTKKFGVTKQKY